jgi:hypothetical protein
LYNSKKTDTNKTNNESDSEITQVVVKVPNNQSNFEALEQTPHVPYLKNISLDFENDDREYWEKVDTNTKNDLYTIVTRYGGCMEKTENEECIDQQTYTIDKNNNKVTKFSGFGSGYMAKISFEYNQKDQLVKYSSQDEIYLFEYKKDKLVKVVGKLINRDEKQHKTILFE